MTTTSTRTLADVETLAATAVLDHLDRQVTVGVLSGLQRQGDVGFLPASIATAATASPAPITGNGVALVSSGQGGHTHLLVADGDVTWAPVVRSRELGDVGVFTVAAGATAFVIHPEHGALGFAPGAYLVRRQVEMADELRIVAD